MTFNEMELEAQRYLKGGRRQLLMTLLFANIKGLDGQRMATELALFYEYMKDCEDKKRERY